MAQSRAKYERRQKQIRYKEKVQEFNYQFFQCIRWCVFFFGIS